MKERILVGLILGGICGIIGYFIFDEIQTAVVFGVMMFMMALIQKNRK